MALSRARRKIRALRWAKVAGGGPCAVSLTVLIDVTSGLVDHVTGAAGSVRRGRRWRRRWGRRWRRRWGVGRERHGKENCNQKSVSH